jgi:hypothetical protein
VRKKAVEAPEMPAPTMQMSAEARGRGSAAGTSTSSRGKRKRGRGTIDPIRWRREEKRREEECCIRFIGADLNFIVELFVNGVVGETPPRKCWLDTAQLLTLLYDCTRNRFVAPKEGELGAILYFWLTFINFPELTNAFNFVDSSR